VFSIVLHRKQKAFRGLKILNSRNNPENFYPCDIIMGVLPALEIFAGTLSSVPSVL
jgi:hypothetical protein